MDAPPSRNASPREGLICVVDDDEAVRRALDNLLASAGYASISFASAEACLASGRRDDFVFAVLDIALGGMDGFALQQRLCAGKPLPLVFLSAHDDAGTRRRAFDAGALALLRKPIDADRLFSHIAAALS